MVGATACHSTASSGRFDRRSSAVPICCSRSSHAAQQRRDALTGWRMAGEQIRQRLDTQERFDIDPVVDRQDGLIQQARQNLLVTVAGIVDQSALII